MLEKFVEAKKNRHTTFFYIRNNRLRYFRINLKMYLKKNNNLYKIIIFKSFTHGGNFGDLFEITLLLFASFYIVDY